MNEYDVIVLGLGALGSGAAYWLAKRGARVLGLEQFEFGHARGESHDRSRIIRLSYFSPAYVRLAKEAYAAWEALERDAGERVVFKTGGLDIGPRDGAIPLEPYADVDAGLRRAVRAARRRRDSQALAGLAASTTTSTGSFSPTAAIVAAERATAAHRRAAQRIRRDAARAHAGDALQRRGRRDHGRSRRRALSRGQARDCGGAVDAIARSRTSACAFRSK